VRNLFARRAAADQVDGEIMGQAQQKGSLIANAFQHRRTLGNFNEDLLQQISGVRLVAGQVQQERKKSLRVVVIQPLEISTPRHLYPNDALQVGNCLEILTSFREEIGQNKNGGPFPDRR
jgi:hypothetical protein